MLCRNAWLRQQNIKIQPYCIIYADLECLLEKMHLCQNKLEKSYTEKKKLSIHLLVTHCLQIVHLMQQKTNLIVTDVKSVLKGFVKI